MYVYTAAAAMTTQPLVHVKEEPHEEEMSTTIDPTGMYMYECMDIPLCVACK